MSKVDSNLPTLPLHYISESGEEKIAQIPLTPMGGAMILALIAYPNSINKRESFVRACIASYLKTVQERNLDVRNHLANKQYLKMRWRDIDRRLSNGLSILRNRFKLHHFLMNDFYKKAILKYKVTGFSFQLKSSLYNDLSVEADKKIQDRKMFRDNFYQQKWKPLKTGIHLIMAISNSQFLHGKKKHPFDIAITETEWIPDFVKNANDLFCIYHQKTVL